MNHFWLHSSTNYYDTKTHNKTRRHQSRDQNQTSTQSGTGRNQSQKFPIFNPKILGLNHMAYHSPEDNLCHFLTFRLKIFKVEKFSTLWSLMKFQDFCTHTYLSPRRLTLPLSPTKIDGSISVDLREKVEFLSLPLFSFAHCPSLFVSASFSFFLFFLTFPISFSFPFSFFFFLISFFFLSI